MNGKGKGEVCPITGHEDPDGGVEVQLEPLFNFRARWACVVNVTPRSFYPRESDPVLIVQEAGWAL